MALDHLSILHHPVPPLLSLFAINNFVCFIFFLFVIMSVVVDCVSMSILYIFYWVGYVAMLSVCEDYEISVWLVPEQT